MPVYDYICENGHREELLREYTERDNGGECKTCGCALSYTIAGGNRPVPPVEKTKSGVNIRWRHGKPRVIIHWRDYTCNSCGHEDGCDATNAEQEYDPSVVVCDECSSSDVNVHFPRASIDRFSERFPYFDRGLGIMLRSKQHRRDVCRARGLIPVDGDIDVSEQYKREKVAEAKDEAILSDMRQRLKDHPGYADYRRLRDRGWTPNYKYRRQ